jgi:hypothetical protein
LIEGIHLKYLFENDANLRSFLKLRAGVKVLDIILIIHNRLNIKNTDKFKDCKVKDGDTLNIQFSINPNINTEWIAKDR